MLVMSSKMFILSDTTILTVLIKFKTTESKISDLPSLKETDYDRKAENTVFAVVWLHCAFNYTSWTFLGKPNHKRNKWSTYSRKWSVLYEHLESAFARLSASRIIVFMRRAGCELRYSTLTTVSPVLAVSHLMTGSVTLEWKLLMKKTLGHITPLKFSSSWIMQMSLTRRVSQENCYILLQRIITALSLQLVHSKSSPCGRL